MSVGSWSYGLKLLPLSSIMHRSEKLFKVKWFDRHVGGLSLVWIRNNVAVQRNRLFAEGEGPFDSRVRCPPIELRKRRWENKSQCAARASICGTPTLKPVHRIWMPIARQIKAERRVRMLVPD
jgi:hypothetical protein